MADAPDSKSGPRKRVWVQLPPPVLAPFSLIVRDFARAPSRNSCERFASSMTSTSVKRLLCPMTTGRMTVVEGR